MSNDNQTLNASCLCGSARHQIRIPSSALPLPLYICHCDSCRHTTGSLAFTVTFLPDEYAPTEDTVGNLVPFFFSKRTTLYHCGVCGSHMLARCLLDINDLSKGSSWGVATGTLEKAQDVLKLKGHEHVADTLDGGFADFLTVCDGTSVPRWRSHFDEGEQLPLRWEHSDRPKINPQSTDRLHAHCKCGGIEFWLARPSERSKRASSSWPDLLIPHHSGKQGVVGTPWWLRDDGKKYLAGVCSCDSCRLDTGTEWMEWAFVPDIDITLDKDGRIPFSRDFGTLKSYSSSKGVTRHHCGACGASVFFFSEDRPHVIDVSVALLDAPEGARAESWLEFWWNRVSFREDAVSRAESLTLGVEEGLKDFAAWKYPHQLSEEKA